MIFVERPLHTMLFRYVDMTEEGRRVDGEPEDVWQDY